MAIFRVAYRSMTASYGPSYIEAESEYEARKKFAGNAFNWNTEGGCIVARQVSSDEMMKALRKQSE